MNTYTIIGPGAVGCFCAARLHCAGFSPVLVDYKNDRSERLSHKGITLIEDSSEQALPIPVYPDLDSPPQNSICFVCIKSYSTESFLKNNNQHLNKFKSVIFIQNGITWIDLCSGPETDYAPGGGIAYFGVTGVSEGRVKLAGNGSLYIGPLSSENTALYNSIAADFTKAGIQTAAGKDVIIQAWEKFLVNLGINPLTVLYSCKNGELLDKGEREEKLEEVVSEGVKTACAQGFDFDEQEIVHKTKETCRTTALNISSMLQDVQAQRDTELEAITGALLKKAGQFSIDTKTNREVYDQLKTYLLEKQ